MKLTGQKWSGALCAASAVMMLLFTGNWLVGQAVPVETGQQIAVVETLAASVQRETEPEGGTQAPTAQTTSGETQEPRRTALEEAASGIRADSVFVFHTASGEMLFCSTDPAMTLYPASITKLFSAWVALKYLSPDMVITAGDEVALVQPGSSRAYISRGCRMTVEMLIEAMLLPSGNDAAYVLAAAAGRAAAEDETLSGDAAVEAFVEAMNRHAQKLGLTGSHFTNPDGYHQSAHISCPEDMVRMGLLALQEPVIVRYAALQQDSVVFESGQWITWYNTNDLLNPESEFFVPEAVGLKTGYTAEAGYCLLTAFREEDGYVLVGIFGAESKQSRYADAITLWQLCR